MFDFFDKGMRWRYKAKITQTLASPELVGVKVQAAAGDRLLLDTVVVQAGTFAGGRNIFSDFRDVSDDITIENLMSNTGLTTGQYLRMLRIMQSNATVTTANATGKLNEFVVVSGDDAVRVGGTDLAQNEFIRIVLSGWVEHDKPTVTYLGSNQTSTEVYNKTV